MPETVHACPPDVTGLTPCCRRPPSELPPTDRMTPDPAPLPGLHAEPGAGPAVVRCRLCGHPLTNRAAQLLRLGDECARKLGHRDVRGPGRFQVEQDGLPGV
ncbi:DUF6011 domain-containing protein [Actinacidiphila sp. ITFR-21]|uniref:DUF6011 domain-containing protein n=1 Tax=Actinacidiphila sp. ITFR-21 TaxID=3075199 RepID=UPI002889C6B2|nr:DUF6011 domain-containing protein [Streptomyces sp. ITFR-21]WNI19154.1 DUF6011 domain-containing protein [Streptomyces sp. ITFR-21]